MARSTLFFLLLSLLIFSSCQPTTSSTEHNKKQSTMSSAYTDLDVAAFKAKMANEHVVVLDVRSPQETALGKIEGAIEIDYNAGNFAEQSAQLDKEKTYLIYCRSGVRSVHACNIMKEQGFSDLYNLLGGYIAWSAL